MAIMKRFQLDWNGSFAIGSAATEGRFLLIMEALKCIVCGTRHWSTLAVLLISAIPASAGDIVRWQCGKTVVQVYLEYAAENSVGGESPEPTYTLRFVNPPKGHNRRPPGFTFKWSPDAEGPLFWWAS